MPKSPILRPFLRTPSSTVAPATPSCSRDPFCGCGCLPRLVLILRHNLLLASPRGCAVMPFVVCRWNGHCWLEEESRLDSKPTRNWSTRHAVSTTQA